MRKRILPRYLVLIGLASLIAIGLAALLAISIARIAVAEPLQGVAPGPPATVRIVMAFPTPNIPRLTEEERSKAIAIATSDSRMRKLLEGRKYSITGVGVWHTPSLKKLGAGMAFFFTEPTTFDLVDWARLEADETETTTPPYRQIITRLTVRNTRGLIVSVDLQRSAVVGIFPAGGEFFLPDGTKASGPVRLE